MYSEFQTNMMATVLTHHIINIYMTSGEKIIIGVGGHDKKTVHFNSFGFYIRTISAALWYSYAHIVKIEVY